MKTNHLLAASAAALGLVMAGLPAQAQTQPDMAPDATSPFSSDEAALCAATFEWMIQFMRPGPEETAQDIEMFNMQNNLAAMMWSYELYASMGGADEEAVETKFNEGAQALTQNFPTEETADADNQVVTTVMTQAGECGRKLKAEYPDGNHPIVTELEKQAAAMQQQQQNTAPADE